MRGCRALVWLACVGACAGQNTKPSPRAAKQDAVDAARDVSSDKAAGALKATAHGDPVEEDAPQTITEAAAFDTEDIERVAGEGKALSGSTARNAAADMVADGVPTQTRKGMAAVYNAASLPTSAITALKIIRGEEYSCGEDWTLVRGAHLNEGRISFAIRWFGALYQWNKNQRSYGEGAYLKLCMQRGKSGPFISDLKVVSNPWRQNALIPVSAVFAGPKDCPDGYDHIMTGKGANGDTNQNEVEDPMKLPDNYIFICQKKSTDHRAIEDLKLVKTSPDRCKEPDWFVIGGTRDGGDSAPGQLNEGTQGNWVFLCAKRACPERGKGEWVNWIGAVFPENIPHGRTIMKGVKQSEQRKVTAEDAKKLSAHLELAGKVSGSVPGVKASGSVEISQRFARDFSTDIMREQSETVTYNFTSEDRGKAVWSWTWSVVDACGGTRAESESGDIAITIDALHEPCCLPGLAWPSSDKSYTQCREKAHFVANPGSHCKLPPSKWYRRFVSWLGRIFRGGKHAK